MGRRCGGLGKTKHKPERENWQRGGLGDEGEKKKKHLKEKRKKEEKPEKEKKKEKIK